MSNKETQEREEKLKIIAKKMQDSGIKFPDIREREWLKSNSKVSKALNYIIEAENILLELDDYQMENNQLYPEIEDMMLQLGSLRRDFTNFVDNNLEILKLK